jgi:hypothetical protein
MNLQIATQLHEIASALGKFLVPAYMVAVVYLLKWL